MTINYKVIWVTIEQLSSYYTTHTDLIHQFVLLGNIILAYLVLYCWVWRQWLCHYDIVLAATIVNNQWRLYIDSEFEESQLNLSIKWTRTRILIIAFICIILTFCALFSAAMHCFQIIHCHRKTVKCLSALGLLEALTIATNNNDRQSIYQILCTKARALFDAKQLQNAILVFNKAKLLLIKIQKYEPKPYDLYDRDLYRNTALCYESIAQEYCSVVCINSTKPYAVKNTEKSMAMWDKSAKSYHETVKIVKHIFGTNSFEYIQALYEWSDVLCTKGNYNKSYHMYQNTRTIFKQLDGNEQKEYVTIMDKTKQMIQTLRSYINDNTL